MVKLNSELFINKKKKWKSLTFYTSGSSGNPMKALIHPVQWIIEQAVIYRHWKWHGYKFRDKCAMIRSYSPSQDEPLIKYNWILNTFYYSPFHLDDHNMEIYYRHMLTEEINYLRGYPSSIKIFAIFCSKRNYSLPSLKFILTASEVLSLEDRDFIEKTFSVKIGNHYGLAEQIVMFGNCSMSRNLHNYNEYGFCELIPTDDEKVFRIIGTNLHNKTMPLIRYDTGDLAYIENETECDCGRKGILINNVIGRNDIIIKDSMANEIPTVNFYTLMQYYTNIDQWQIIIYPDDTFLLTYTGDMFTSSENISIIEGLTNRLSNTKLKPFVKKVNQLKKISEGKIPRIIYEK